MKNLIILLLLSPICYGQEINKEHRIQNEKYGYCGWCCLETLGRYHKIKELEGLVNYYKTNPIWRWNGSRWIKIIDGTANYAELTAKLELLKVDFEGQLKGDSKLIEKAIEKKLGCVIGVRNWPEQHTLHFVIVVGLTKDRVKFIDPNKIEKNYDEPVKWLEKYWDGLVIVIIPSE